MKGVISKLGANDRTHAVAIAVTLGIVRLELASMTGRMQATAEGALPMPKPARGCDHRTGRFMYYMHDEFAAFRFRLIGDLSEASTAELDQARQTASSIFNGRPLIVDLTGIDSVDSAGRELIARWHGLGAQLVVDDAGGPGAD